MTVCHEMRKRVEAEGGADQVDQRHIGEHTLAVLSEHY